MKKTWVINMPQLFTKKCPVCETELAGYGLEHLKKVEEAHMASHDIVPQGDAPEPKPELEPGKTVEGEDFEEPKEDVMEDLDSALSEETEERPKRKKFKKSKKR